LLFRSELTASESASFGGNPCFSDAADERQNSQHLAVLSLFFAVVRAHLGREKTALVLLSHKIRNRVFK
jgi:hypothetical protein